MRRRTRAGLLGALALVLVGAAGCGSGSSGGGGGDTLRVFAAASLTGSFTELAHTFEADHPGTTVQLNFGPSSGLAEQVRSGAPADVFASASPEVMDGLVEDDAVEEPRDFARNRLAVAVPPDNPGGIASLADLARPGVKLAVCQAQVPCGAVAAEVLDRAGLDVRPATEEVDVKAVLTKVTLGEVDAGLVYVTDVRAAGDDVRGVEIPEDSNASTTYPIAVVGSTEQQRLAQEFVDLVLSTRGTGVLRDAGFASP